jgi:hypothetical protein
MLYREIIAVCSEIQTKHMNVLCKEKMEYFNFKHRGFKWRILKFNLRL